jgi:hypothetical protein
MLSTPQLTPDITGQVLTPEDCAYGEARTVFAAHIDRRPALIARVRGPDDIARVIAQPARPGPSSRSAAGGTAPRATASATAAS